MRATPAAKRAGCGDCVKCLRRGCSEKLWKLSDSIREWYDARQRCPLGTDDGRPDDHVQPTVRWTIPEDMRHQRVGDPLDSTLGCLSFGDKTSSVNITARDNAAHSAACPSLSSPHPPPHRCSSTAPASSRALVLVPLQLPRGLRESATVATVAP